MIERVASEKVNLHAIGQMEGGEVRPLQIDHQLVHGVLHQDEACAEGTRFLEAPRAMLESSDNQSPSHR